jgi:hypothetical protein
MTQVELVFRQYADGTYGVGEVVIPGVTLFRAGNHGLTKEEAEVSLRKQRSGRKQ